MSTVLNPRPAAAIAIPAPFTPAPIFALLGFVGLTDGLMRRDLRKFRVEHESSFVYHIAKSLALPLMISGCIMYLSMPFTIHPNLVITPYAVLFAYTLSVMASKFKNYL